MFLLLAAALMTADQLSKFWAKTTFPLYGEEFRMGLGFSLTYVRNNGAAFGILQNLSFPIGPVTLNGTILLGILSGSVALALLIFLLRSRRRLSALQLIALTLILSGAVGNMIDRLRLGYVVDFIHFQVPGFNFPVFNLADSCVVVGAILLIAGNLFSPTIPRSAGTSVGNAKNLNDADFFQHLDSSENP